MRQSAPILALFVCLGAAPAWADETPAQTNWYGWQVLVVDAGALGLVTGAVYAVGTTAPNLNRTALALGVAAGVVFVAGAPILHLAHHRPGNAAISLALRTGIPLAAALVGSPLLGAVVLGGVPFLDAFANSTETLGPRVTLAPVTDRGQPARGVALALHF